MPKHQDATGYLNDLATEIQQPWFRMICDLAAVSEGSDLDEITSSELYALYTKQASYIGVKPATSVAAAATSTAAIPTDFLEQLSGFVHFKLLGDALDVTFKKRVTLIFGSNGSGKSSLCESLKALATPELPSRPLENLRAAGPVTPKFQFKFKSDAGPQTWTPAAGYGPRRTTIKYFDTAIAIQNVTGAVEPGRVIAVTPFKLHAFEWVKALTTKLRGVLQAAQNKNSANLTRALEEIRTAYAEFNAYPLSSIEEKTISTLVTQIKLGEEFKAQDSILAKRAVAAELEKATSEEGLKLLGAEHRELEFLLMALNSLLISAADLWAIGPAKKSITVANMQAAQEVIAKQLIPEGSTLEGLMALLRAASSMCEMSQAANHACPLCKRILGVSEVELFTQYHSLLVVELEKDITALKTDLTKARELAVRVGELDRKTWDNCKTISAEILAAATINAEVIVASCNITNEPTAEAEGALASLKASVVAWTAQLESKRTAIETAAKGRDELVNQLARVRKELEPLEYAQAISVGMENLCAAQQMASNAQFWTTNLPAFTQLLRRITETAKDAYEDLVVADFEARLGDEYTALAEKKMAAFGVELARKGADAAVTVLPQVGGKRIDGVLSEGEQRLHALALFFAELETCQQSVVVFDDPVSSFDYNYIANYCTRLRDFTVKHPERQIIVLTHNWEFFVQLQTSIKQARLNDHLSVNVLESCAVVAEYSDKIDDLKKDINAALALPSEPGKAKKEEISGKMRRLIEAVVNTHVFNQERHQYKQKSQQITAFQNFTKVVALLPTEANLLRDLYARLSITEHDDPRNAYLNTDKAMFKKRYEQILAVEAALVARKPS